jgi:hypothetical protein
MKVRIKKGCEWLVDSSLCVRLHPVNYWLTEGLWEPAPQKQSLLVSTQRGQTYSQSLGEKI